MRKLMLVILVLLAPGMLLAQNTPTAPTSQTVTLTLVNQSPNTICHLFITSTAAMSWGNDWLNSGETIAPGTARQFSMAADDYNLLLQDCNQNILEQLATLPIRQPLTLIHPNPSGATLLTIGNGSASTAICAAFIAPINAWSWGSNWLTNNETIAPGAIQGFMVAPDNYDILLQDCQQNTLDERRSVAIRQPFTLTYGGQAQPPVTLTLINTAEISICYVFISPVAATLRGNDWLNTDETIPPGGTRNFTVTPGDYTITLEDCNQAELGEYANVSIRQAVTLTYPNEAPSIPTQPSVQPPADGVRLTIGNLGTVDICDLLISPSTAAIGSEDLLNPGESLALGRLVSVTVTPGIYNLLWQDCAGSPLLDQRNVAIQRALTVNYAGETTTTSWAILTLENALSATVCDAFIAPVTATTMFDWLSGEDDTIAIGSAHDFLISSGEYDIALQDCNGTDLDGWNNLAIQQPLTITATGAGLGEVGAGGADMQHAVELNDQGLAWQQEGRYTEALAAFEEALAIIRQSTDRASEATLLENIAGVYSDQGQYTEALDYYNQALPIRRETDDREGEGSTLQNIGSVYHKLEQYDQALTYYQQALPLLQEFDNRAEVATTLNNIGAAYHSLAQYDQSLNYYQQALSVRRETVDRPGEAATLGNLAVLYADWQQYDQALATLQLALPIYQELTDRAAEGDTLYDIAQIYYRQGQYDQALNYYQQTLIIRRELNDQPGISVTLNNLSSAYSAQGQYTPALEFLQEALEIQIALADLAGQGITLNNIGGLCNAQGQYTLALNYYQQALAIHRQLGNRAEEGVTLNNIGTVYSSQGLYPLALDSLRQALAIAEADNDPANQSMTLNNIGGVYGGMGQYTEALNYYQQAVTLAQATDEYANEASALNNIGGVYDNLGQLDQALGYYQQALTIAQTIADRPREGTALNNIGGVYNNLGQYDQALAYYQQALAIAIEVNNRPGESSALNNIGSIYRDQGQYDQALAYYEQSLALARELGNRASEGIMLNNVGIIHFYQNQYDQAMESIQEALVISRELGDRAGEIISLDGLGLVYEAWGQPQTAIGYYEQAADLVEIVHAEIGLQGGQAAFAAQWQNTHPYDRLVALLSGDSGATAFDYAERGRARTLLFQLGNEQLVFGAGADAELLNQWQAKRDEIVALRAQRVEIANQLIASAAAIQAMDDQIAAAEQQLASLEDQIALQNPEFGQFTRVEIPDLATIQAAIPVDATLVAYYVTGAEVFAFVVTRNNLTVIELLITASELRNLVTTFRLDERAQTAALGQLYAGLIAPLTSNLITANLVIAPHDVLNYVPFAALRNATGRYLGDDFTISYIPSATVYTLLAQRALSSATGGVALVFGNPTTADARLRSLPFAEAEAQIVAAELGVTPFLGANATEGLLRQQIRQANIIHIAAHGIFNAHNPLSSFLALAPDGQYDGFLEMREVYGLPLREQSPLVVLSACQTAVGELTAGDEFQGLTRAFLLSGARTVVASLWSVDDQATGVLMTAFYRNRAAGMTDAAALTAAQRTLRQDAAHPQWAEPYFWAAFVLVGRG